MMAAALAKGRTTLVNCAREPEVEELGRVLNKMGAEVDGAGTDVIHITGSERGELAPFDHAIIPDRIEAGTYMVAAAIAEGGDVVLEGAELADLEALVVKMRAAGVEVASEGQPSACAAAGPLRAVNVTTAPHPGLPHRHAGPVPGAHVPSRAARASSARPSSRTASCTCPSCSAWAPASPCAATPRWSRASTSSTARASWPPTSARARRSSSPGLVAEDETEVRRVYHIDRGYERIEEKLRGVGANIERVHGAES